ncbi:FadR/GntR family transcriptional regulator [Alicyclobacillus shizuokensis]|uniref:FadR/GntR family transcriptional regulator n=1 Tax=Alicyclobacillus shizuokensis TaxID=392014 RepID=UPI00082F5F30|nr:FadR/GntR family transcriptional regulator [Alicyclobacillus shizuokensis]
MPSLQPIRTTKTTEAVTERLKEAILGGVFAPGSRLPSVRELSQQFLVGQAAVREALSALKAMHLVTVKQGEGTFVTRFDASALARQATATGVLTRQEMRHLLELRRVVEGGAARLAAGRRTTADMETLAGALAEMEADIASGSVGEAADWTFHRAVAAASGNPLFPSLLDTIAEKVQAQLYESRRRLYERPGEAQTLLRQHQHIAQAISAADGDGAEAAMQTHLLYVESRLHLEHPSTQPSEEV